MEKDFLEVFFGLEVEKELKALLEDVKVTKIAVNPKKDRMRVYIQSIQWIQKKYISIYCKMNWPAEHCV